MIFDVIHMPNFNLLHELYILSGENCHLNPGILEANFVKGTTLLVLRVSREDQTFAWGVARESNNPFARRLVFKTLPLFIEKSEQVTNCFWKGLRDYCQKRHVLQVDMNAFNSAPIEVPDLGPKAKIINRKEYILDLKQISKDGIKRLSSNHRRNIRKGERADLSCQIRKDFAACRDHARMMANSMRRRQNLGQSIHYEPSPAKWFAYIQCNAGFIMQAKKDDDWVSSLLIFRSGRQAYYVSGGTSHQGMQLGAAHFLMWNVIQHLSSAEIPILNLGGVTETDTAGLERFKAGFGAEPTELPHRSFIMGNPWRYRIARAMRLLR